MKSIHEVLSQGLGTSTHLYDNDQHVVNWLLFILREDLCAIFVEWIDY